jgi:hypothetical protein
MAKTDALITFGATGEDQVTAAMKKVGAEVDRTTARMKNNTQAMNRMVKSGGAVDRQFRLIRGGAGQVGHQIQDMAVQFQAGTDAAIVLGQQGSQIASLFGSQGAVIGAIGAIGAAIYTSISKTSIQAEKDLRALKEEMMQTATSADGFTESLREISRAKTLDNIDSIKNQISELADEFDESFEFMSRLATFQKMEETFANGAGALNPFASAIMDLSRAFVFNDEAQKEATRNVQLYQYYQAELEKQLKNTEQVLKNIAAGKANPFITDESAEQFLKQLKETKDTYGMTEIALLNYQKAKLIEAGVSDEVIAKINQEIAAYKERKQQVDQQTEADRAAKAESDNYARSKENFIEKLDRLNQKQTLTAAQMLALEGAEYDLNEEQRKTLALIVAKTAARDEETRKAREKAEADRKLAEAEKAERERQAKLQPEVDRIRGVVRDFTSLQESFKTEEQLILESEENKLKILDEMYKIRGEKDQQYYDLRNKIQTEADNALVSAERGRQAELVGLMSGQLQQLSSFFDQSTALGKAAFVANQTLAVANAIISAEEASAKALALYPQMPAYAGMIKAMGYASAGAIAGQTLASFEGGGITFSGVRSGGLDGKGGRLAVVHSNEKITDLEKGGDSQPVQISFNISAVDSKGIDQLLMERRGMITSMVQKAVNNRGKRIM